MVLRLSQGQTQESNADADLVTGVCIQDALMPPGLYYQVAQTQHDSHMRLEQAQGATSQRGASGVRALLRVGGQSSKAGGVSFKEQGGPGSGLPGRLGDPDSEAAAGEASGRSASRPGTPPANKKGKSVRMQVPTSAEVSSPAGCLLLSLSLGTDSMLQMQEQHDAFYGASVSNAQCGRLCLPTITLSTGGMGSMAPS